MAGAAIKVAFYFQKGGIQLRCGSKCFLVEMEIAGEKKTQSINARTPAEARKTIRLQYDAEVQILSVKKEKKL